MASEPQSRSLACPICKSEMRTELVEGVSADICSAHGMWLDKGELETIVTGVRGEQQKRADRVIRNAAISDMMQQNAERERRFMIAASMRFR